MRILIPLIVLLLISSAKSEVDANEVTDFLEGFVNGIGVERLAPSIHKCVMSAGELKLAIKDVIHAINERQPFYNLVNNITWGLKTLSPFSRECADVPEDVRNHLKEDYFKKFHDKWELYTHAVSLNLGYRMDEVAGNVLKIRQFIEKKDFINVGYYSGDILNLVLNVTTPSPVPIPDPTNEPYIMKHSFVQPVTYELEEVPTDWKDIHTFFREYFNYTMIVFNYTKWVNVTTYNNLNSSVSNLELNLYLGLIEFTKDKPNIREAVLNLIDTTYYINGLFNGVYFSIKQVPEKMFKDTIFEHLDYWYMNLIQHAGYFLYDGYKLIEAIIQHNLLNVCRRATIIVRKIIYFDEDVIDEINNKVPVQDI